MARPEEPLQRLGWLLDASYSHPFAQALDSMDDDREPMPKLTRRASSSPTWTATMMIPAQVPWMAPMRRMATTGSPTSSTTTRPYTPTPQTRVRTGWLQLFYFFDAGHPFLDDDALQGDHVVQPRLLLYPVHRYCHGWDLLLLPHAPDSMDGDRPMPKVTRRTSSSPTCTTTMMTPHTRCPTPWTTTGSPYPRMTRRTCSPTWTATMRTPRTSRRPTHGRATGPHAQADEDLEGDHDDTPHKLDGYHPAGAPWDAIFSQPLARACSTWMASEGASLTTQDSLLAGDGSRQPSEVEFALARHQRK